MDPVCVGKGNESFPVGEGGEESARFSMPILDESYGKSWEEEDLIRSVPKVEFEPIEERHLLVHALHPTRDEEPPEAALMTSAALLKAIDGTLEIEDIQGVPKRFWRLLIS